MKARHFIALALVLVGCSSTDTHRATTLTPEQAGLRARQLANEKAGALCGSQPFQNGPPARSVQGRWVWHDRLGWGVGDMEATVILAADGSVESVKVIQLYDQP